MKFGNLPLPKSSAAVDDHAADRGAVAADVLGGGVHDDVGAVLDRAAEVRAGGGVVDDERYAVLVRDAGNTPMSMTLFFGLGRVSPKKALVLSCTAADQASRSSGLSMNETVMPILGRV